MDDAHPAIEGLDGGGERYVPELHRGTMLEPEHHCRYEWIAPLASGRDVLDAGCGVGWGSLILASNGARSVVGVDIDESAIVNARERAAEDARDHAAPETDFVRGDLRRLPFDDGSFDLVACFEAIEHVEEPSEVVNELRRVLRRGGILAVSSPNRGIYPEGNPFHLHELTTSELTEALESCFQNVSVYRQQTYVGSFVSVAVPNSDSRPAADADARLMVLSDDSARDAIYSVGLASDCELPSVPELAVLGAPIDHKEFQPPSVFLQLELEDTREQLRATKHALTEAELARASAERLLESHRQSLSWRLTKPLRALKRTALRTFNRRAAG
jgi:SAM-dependent methyltransferase